MRGQQKLDVSGISRVSLLDAGLGIGAGLVVPFLAEQAIVRWAPTEQTWMQEYKAQLAAGVGLVVAIPLFYFRGLGPAVIAGACALTYAIGPMLSNWLSTLSATSSTAASGVLSPRASMGRLQAARARAMGRLQSAPRRAVAGAPGLSAAIQGATF